jgi:pyruvate dehydrogenase E1 component
MTEDLDPVETGEWLDSLDGVIDVEGPQRAHYLLEKLIGGARRRERRSPTRRRRRT